MSRYLKQNSPFLKFNEFELFIKYCEIEIENILPIFERQSKFLCENDKIIFKNIEKIEILYENLKKFEKFIEFEEISIDLIEKDLNDLYEKISKLIPFYNDDSALNSKDLGCRFNIFNKFIEIEQYFNDFQENMSDTIQKLNDFWDNEINLIRIFENHIKLLELIDSKINECNKNLIIMDGCFKEIKENCEIWSNSGKP